MAKIKSKQSNNIVKNKFSEKIIEMVEQIVKGMQGQEFKWNFDDG